MTRDTFNGITAGQSRPENEILHLLQRATLFRVAALTFAEPRVDHCRAVLAALDSVEAFNTWPLDDESQRRFQAVRAVWQGADDDALAGEYARLFMRDCPCPPHESAYGDGCRMGGRAAELADINGFYHAFGLDLSSRDPDLPDHLCAELEFYSTLLLRTAYATWHGREEQREITARAAETFLEQHLGRWVNAFGQRLEKVGCHPVYAASTALLDHLIREECRRIEVQPQPVEGFAGPAPADPVTCPLACRPPD